MQRESERELADLRARWDEAFAEQAKAIAEQDITHEEWIEQTRKYLESNPQLGRSELHDAVAEWDRLVLTEQRVTDE